MYNIEIKILCKLRYRAVKKYHTDHTEDTFIVLSAVYQQFLFLRTILAASVDFSTMKKIHELFLAAYFSQKSKKPSDKVPTVHFLLCNDIVHFATYLVK
jgi:hypothetical protein